MRMEFLKLHYGDYLFTTELDTGAETGEHQLTLWFKEQSTAKSAWHYVRDFYFEEANEQSIVTFCTQFATDEQYRTEALARQTHWGRRNALFVRNLPTVVSEVALLANEGSYEDQVRAFFRWLDVHAEAILALPEYQRLQELDNAFQPGRGKEIDPGIREAIALLNQIPGVRTQFSCQGISGKVVYQEYALLAVTPHEEYAYVSFEELSPIAHDSIVDLLPAYPGITTTRIPYKFGFRSVLRSKGDNLCFRKELLELADRVLERVDQSWSKQQSEERDPSWQDMLYPARVPPGNAPSGLLPTRLEWLCQAEQIERTLQLLFSLNYWARARESFLYTDRQGLYQVKTAILRQAHELGAIHSVVYVDRTKDFAREYNCDLAVKNAAEVYIERLGMLLRMASETVVDEGWDRFAQQLFTRMTGREATKLADVEALDIVQVETYIYEQLEELIEEASRARQPIVTRKLAELFIEPVDLLDMYLPRRYSWLSWDELDTGDLLRLDPEGLSLIAFLYHSPSAHYVFHLPLRVAEGFLSAHLIEELKKMPGHSHEYGIRNGWVISEFECREQPIELVLYELLVDIPTICPQQLTKKQERFRAIPWRNEHGEDEEEESWEEKTHVLCGRRKQSKPQKKCPLCKSEVELVGDARIAHWRERHEGQDLTIGQVAWVLGKTKATLKSAHFALPMAYRLPDPERDGQGTRFWKIEVLEQATQKVV